MAGFFCLYAPDFVFGKRFDRGFWLCDLDRLRRRRFIENV